MLPRPEIDALVLTAQEAADLALSGEAADGYQMLVGGLARVREMAGEPWSAELVRHWAAALERFAQRWGMGSGEVPGLFVNGMLAKSTILP